MNAVAVPFPTELPNGYDWFEGEVEFDPNIHLALERPKAIRYLQEFGYSEEEIQLKATPVAVSSPFRILSDEGARVMLDVARSLRQHAVRCERIDNMVRSGCYRSRFLRDLCLEPSITQLLQEVYGVEIAPHTMPVHLGHMNYSPDDPDKAVDKWHHDTLPLDYVMMVTDPTQLSGGQFEYFVGSKTEMGTLASQDKTPPRDRVETPNFPGPGYAIALHGDMIVHRGAPLKKAAERISMVNGYVSVNTDNDDQHRHKDLTLVDDPECLYAEWARHVAWRARGRLDTLLNNLSFTSDREEVAASLEHAIKDVTTAIEEMRDQGPHNMHHYE